MSLRTVKKQVAALREEIGRHAGREWISIKIPEGSSDDEIATWLHGAVGPDWRRHVIIRLESSDANVPAVLSRCPVGETPGFSGLTISAEDCGLL